VPASSKLAELVGRRACRARGGRGPERSAAVAVRGRGGRRAQLGRGEWWRWSCCVPMIAAAAPLARPWSPRAPCSRSRRRWRRLRARSPVARRDLSGGGSSAWNEKRGRGARRRRARVTGARPRRSCGARIPCGARVLREEPGRVSLAALDHQDLGDRPIAAANATAAIWGDLTTAAARGLELGDQLLGDVRQRVAAEVTATTAAIGDQRVLATARGAGPGRWRRCRAGCELSPPPPPRSSPVRSHRAAPVTPVPSRAASSSTIRDIRQRVAIEVAASSWATSNRRRTPDTAGDVTVYTSSRSQVRPEALGAATHRDYERVCYCSDRTGLTAQSPGGDPG